MQNAIELLDREFARYFGCRPQDLRSGRITVLSEGTKALAVGVTSGGAVVASNLIDAESLRSRLRDCAPERLLDSQVLGRLLALLPDGGTLRQAEHDVLLYCTSAAFTPWRTSQCRPVPRDDPLWQRDDAAPALVAGFGVYVDDARVSTATLVNRGRGPFRAVGITTKAEHRGKGYAKACVAAVTAYALESGLVPLYNTRADNAASLAVARAVGFREYIHLLSVS